MACVPVAHVSVAWPVAHVSGVAAVEQQACVLPDEDAPGDEDFAIMQTPSAAVAARDGDDKERKRMRTVNRLIITGSPGNQPGSIPDNLPAYRE